MNQLVAINVFTLFFLDLLYLIEKVAQYQAFNDYSVQVEEVTSCFSIFKFQDNSKV
jgi:hypothetical protein